jgi:glycerol-3-phosphate dehydrogenase
MSNTKATPPAVAIDDGEIDYLVKAANRFFKGQVNVKHIFWTYSGVRPLVDDGQSTTHPPSRAITALIADQSHGPLILSVFGGKLTTYRKLSEQAVDRAVQRCRKYKFKPCQSPTAKLSAGRRYTSRPAWMISPWSRSRSIPWLGEALVRRYSRYLWHADRMSC